VSLFSKKNILYVSSIAAALILLFNINNLNQKVTYDSLEFETVENYLINEELVTDELAFLYDETEFTDQTLDAIQFTDDAMDDYINNNLEINDLYTE